MMTDIEKDVNRANHPKISELVENNTAFAIDLYQQLCLQAGNIFYSPLSISTILALTYAGARGRTAEQMAQALHFHLEQNDLPPAFGALLALLAEIDRKGQVALLMANSLWPQEAYPFEAAFLALARDYYDVLVTAVDYNDPQKVRTLINTWAEEATKGLIKELIPEGVLDEMTRLVLSNAVYFKGDWARQFDELNTTTVPFDVSPGRQIQVSMMNQKAAFGYTSTDGLQILKLPYAGGDLAMLILLPGERFGLSALEAKLSLENLQLWTRYVFEQDVQVSIPRMKMEGSIQLSEHLKSMGMLDAFDEADFSGMDGTKELFISAILHKACIEVNEAGSEAAAATAVVMAVRSMPLPPPVFRADHPFLFMIVENSTQSILFIGRMVNPGA